MWKALRGAGPRERFRVQGGMESGLEFSCFQRSALLCDFTQSRDNPEPKPTAFKCPKGQGLTKPTKQKTLKKPEGQNFAKYLRQQVGAKHLRKNASWLLPDLVNDFAEALFGDVEKVAKLMKVQTGTPPQVKLVLDLRRLENRYHADDVDNTL